MYPATCTRCGHSFRSECLPAVCPGCERKVTFSRPCWRCKRTFVPADDVGITCEDCKVYRCVCSFGVILAPKGGR
jgi:hypothetical protein